MRDRSVVRSSVMPSAKYSWSGSRDRFSNGNTTKDRRGIATLIEPGGPAVGQVTAGAFRCGQAHQTALAMPIAAISAAAMKACCQLTNRRARAGSVGDAASDVEAAAFGLIA